MCRGGHVTDASMLRAKAEPSAHGPTHVPPPCSAAQPALLTACGVAHGATRIPLYQCIAGGEVVEVCAAPHAAARCCCRSAAAAALGPVAPAAPLPAPAPPLYVRAMQSYVGGVPAEVVKMIQRQLAELRRAHGGGVLPKLLLAAGRGGRAGRRAVVAV